MQNQPSKSEQSRTCPCDAQMVAVLTIGVIAGILIGFVLGWLWVKHWQAWTGVRLVELLTALGTCGAVIVAVGLHRESVTRSKKEQQRRARLYAVETRVSLQYFHNLARELKTLNFKMVSSPPTQEDLRAIEYFAGEIIGFDQVRNMDIARFDCLSKRIPTNLAIGISQLVQGAMAAQANLRVFALTPENLRILQNPVLGAHLWLQGGFDIFGSAIEALKPEIDICMAERT